MKNLSLVLGLLLSSILTSSDRAQAHYFPPGDPKAGGIRDLMLIYLGKEDWAPKDFLPYVAYLGKENAKKPLDWFYDSYLMLAYGGAPSGEEYIDGATNRSDWQYYLDELLFKEGRSLSALETCIRDVENQLGPRGRKTPVIIMIPYPSTAQKDFGDVDGDGRSEDLSQPADRLKAVRWCVDEILRRWERAGLSTLSLWGFYWMNEGIGPHDEAIVRATADYVHQRGYGLHWIPYYNAPGCDKLPQLGIDFAVLQPNYAFMEQSGRRPDEQRLEDTARQARKWRLGIEIEMTASLSALSERNNLWDYLVHGRDEFGGYMRGAVHAYYQGTYAIAGLCYSKSPADRALYEALYQFAKGTFQGERTTFSRHSVYRIHGQLASEYPDDGQKLTDGRFAATLADAHRFVGLLGDHPQIELDLGDVHRIEGVEVRIKKPLEQAGAVTGKANRIGLPRSITVATSTMGQTWESAGFDCRWSATRGDGVLSGSIRHEFPARDARFVRITLDQDPERITLVDEMAVLPTVSLADGASYALSPAPARPQADDDCSLLVDGLYARPSQLAAGTVSWATGQEATILLELPHTRHVGSLRIHVANHAEAGPEAIGQIRVTTRADGSAAWQTVDAAVRSGNHFLVDARASLAKELRVVVTPQPGRKVALDEIEIYRAESLARGKPYDLVPAHPEKYGDPERTRLTDGVISQQGFGDGRMVGWYGHDVEATLDLEQSHAIDGARVHAEGGGVGAVHFPARIDVLLSQDGRNWSRVDSIEQAPKELLLDRPVETTRVQLGWMTGHWSPVDARYVKLRVAPQQWIMISEIEVHSHGKNLVQGKHYRLFPAPDSSAPYADTAGKLTDGVLTMSDFGQGRAVGWDSGRPTVTIDLGSPVPLTRVASHVLGGGLAGVWYPTKMSVATSIDGREWTSEVVTEQRPPERQPSQRPAEALTGFMSVEIPVRTGRYVRLQFVPRGWLMLDEVEVFGPPAP
jgi:hypothetical protein